MPEKTLAIASPESRMVAHDAPRGKAATEAGGRKVALVTGASSGIGYEYSIQLALRGYDVLMVSNEDAVFAKALELSAKVGGTLVLDLPDAAGPEDSSASSDSSASATCPDSVACPDSSGIPDSSACPDSDSSQIIIPLVCDLARTEAAEELYDWCSRKSLEVEVLVNNAGIYHNRDFLDDSAGYNSAIMLLHVYTPTMLMYFFAKDMAARGKGYILNMSSVTSAFAVQRIGIYCSTKAYLRGISRSAHVEMKDKGVIVTCVRPGAVATPLYNLSSTAQRIGLALGYITTPSKLASKGLDALFKGRACITPGLYTKLLDILVRLIPTPLLRLIRRWGIY